MGFGVPRMPWCQFLGHYRWWFSADRDLDGGIGDSSGEAPPVTKVSMSRLTTGYEVSRKERWTPTLPKLFFARELKTLKNPLIDGLTDSPTLVSNHKKNLQFYNVIRTQYAENCVIFQAQNIMHRASTNERRCALENRKRTRLWLNTRSQIKLEYRHQIQI